MAGRSAPETIQGILGRRRQKAFIGREKQLALFQQNLDLPIHSDARRYVFNVSGDGGVGKTTLLRKLEQELRLRDALVVWSNESQSSVCDTLNHFATQLEKQGCLLKKFRKRHKSYAEKLREIETDAPPSLGKALRATVTGAVIAADFLPGLRQGMGLVPKESIESLSDECARYLHKRFSNRDDFELMSRPERTLTKLFLEEVTSISQEMGAHIALFFDGYEVTGLTLDRWIRNLLDGEFGEVSVRFLFCIAGRIPLDQNGWSSFEGIVARFPIGPFSPPETREYLQGKGIVNEEVISVILKESGGLPLLVATLAAEQPESVETIPDPTETAVERYLQWVKDEEQRSLATCAAIPRTLNQDVVTNLVGSDEPASFEWLKMMPFIDKMGSGWVYHEVVRCQMLRYLRRKSPQAFAELHGKVADYYERLTQELRIPERTGWENASWRSNNLEAGYHRLCQHPHSNRCEAVNGFCLALSHSTAYAQTWAQAVEQAGIDAGVESLENWGKSMLEGLRGEVARNGAEVVAFYSDLLNVDNVLEESRAELLVRRAEGLLLQTGYERARDDLLDARQLRQDDFRVEYVLALVHALLGDYDDALRAAEKAVELDGDSPKAHTRLGAALRMVGRLEDSLGAFDTAIQLKSDDEGAFAERGVTLHQLGRYDDSLNALNKAIELNPKEQFAIAERGLVLRLLGRHEESLRDLEEAVSLRPEDAWCLAERGVTLRLLGRLTESLQSLDAASDLQPADKGAIRERAITLRMLGRGVDSLAALDRCIELDPDYQPACNERALTLRSLGRSDKALVLFNQAVERYRDGCYGDWWLYQRAVTNKILGRETQYSEDLATAIDQATDRSRSHPDDWRTSVNLALYRLFGGEPDTAQSIYHQIADQGCPVGILAEAHRDVDELLALFPSAAGGSQIREWLRKRVHV